MTESAAHVRVIEETRHHIRDFDGLAETTKTAQELFAKKGVSGWNL